ncbi:MAG TPA: response regulator [Aggregatilineales bacterium]|nr:response regulator [Anaerolineae bacterium]HUN08305.1 response regulator [Aggregatilineales bacterium]
MRSNQILLVEDNPGLNSMFSKVLIRGGYAVTPVTTLANARVLFDMHPYAVIILDMRLPDGDGLDLLRDRCAVLKQRGTSIIVVSAEEQYRDACEALGVEFFLVKPVMPSMLLSLVGRLQTPQSA